MGIDILRGFVWFCSFIENGWWLMRFLVVNGFREMDWLVDFEWVGGGFERFKESGWEFIKFNRFFLIFWLDFKVFDVYCGGILRLKGFFIVDFIMEVLVKFVGIDIFGRLNVLWIGFFIIVLWWEGIDSFGGFWGKLNFKI